MIRQSEGAAVTDVKMEERTEKGQGHKDSALWAPTGWVHVEKDIDFSDPKVWSMELYQLFEVIRQAPTYCFGLIFIL